MQRRASVAAGKVCIAHKSRPRERVKLTVTLGTKTQTWTSRAGLLGTFLARFPDLVYDRCHGALKVVAVGGRGHRAGFTLQPLPCPDSVTSVKTD